MQRRQQMVHARPAVRAIRPLSSPDGLGQYVAYAPQRAIYPAVQYQNIEDVIRAGTQVQVLRPQPVAGLGDGWTSSAGLIVIALYGLMVGAGYLVGAAMAPTKASRWEYGAAGAVVAGLGGAGTPRCWMPYAALAGWALWQKRGAP